MYVFVERYCAVGSPIHARNVERLRIVKRSSAMSYVCGKTYAKRYLDGKERTCDCDSIYKINRCFFYFCKILFELKKKIFNTDKFRKNINKKEHKKKKNIFSVHSELI